MSDFLSVILTYEQVELFNKEELGKIVKVQAKESGYFTFKIARDNNGLEKVNHDNILEFETALELIINTNDANSVDIKLNNKTKLKAIVWEQCKTIKKLIVSEQERLFREIDKLNKELNKAKEENNKLDEINENLVDLNNKIKYENEKHYNELNKAKDENKKLEEKNADLVSLNKKIKNEYEAPQKNYIDKDNEINVYQKDTKISNISMSKDKLFLDCVPRYNGAIGSKTDEWIFKVEDTAKRLEIKKSELMGLIASKLQGGAFHIYMNSIKQDTYLNWDDFKNEIIKINEESGNHIRYRLELQTLNISKFDFSFSKYLSRFNELRFKVSDCTENELIGYLIGGLPYEVIERIKANNPKSLIEAITMARADVNIFTKNKFTKINEEHYKEGYNRNNFKNEFNSPFKKKFEPDKFQNGNTYRSNNNDNNKKIANNNTIQNSVNMTDQRQITIKRPIICNNCHKPGHKAAQCRLKNIYKTNNARVNYTNKEDEENIPYCSNKNSHYENVNLVLTCENLRFNIIPKIKGLINKKEILCLLDSGASISLMSKNAADMLKIKILKSNEKIKSSTNTIQNVVGKVSNIEIEISDRKTIMEFLIVEHDDFDILLGVNWFKKVKAGVFPGADEFLVFNDNDEFVKTFFVESSQENLNEIETMGQYVEWNENSNEKPMRQIKFNKYQKDKFDNLDWPRVKSVIESIVKDRNINIYVFNNRIQEKNRGRPLKLNKVLLTLLTIMFIFPVTSLNAKYDIELCSTVTKESSVNQMINLESDCREPNYGSNRFKKNSILNAEDYKDLNMTENSTRIITINVLSKLSHVVNGIGYECTEILTKISTYTNFVFANTLETKSTYQKLTAEACKEMIYTKKCGNNVMNCVDSNCEFVPDLTPKYRWLSVSFIQK